MVRDDQCSACLLLMETAIKVLGCIRNAHLLTCIVLKRPIFQASCSMQKKKKKKKIRCPLLENKRFEEFSE